MNANYHLTEKGDKIFASWRVWAANVRDGVVPHQAATPEMKNVATMLCAGLDAYAAVRRMKSRPGGLNPKLDMDVRLTVQKLIDRLKRTGVEWHCYVSLRSGAPLAGRFPFSLTLKAHAERFHQLENPIYS